MKAENELRIKNLHAYNSPTVFLKYENLQIKTTFNYFYTCKL